jgi:hypothetical protein
MDALMVGTAVVGSFIGAFALQKAALEGLLRLMDEGRRHSAAPLGAVTSGSRVQGS